MNIFIVAAPASYAAAPAPAPAYPSNGTILSSQ